METVRERRMTAAEYLAWEERQELKHEYIDGEVIQMPGGTGTHSKIPMNISFGLAGVVDRSRFTFFDSAMQVKVGAARYVYPDLSVVRGRERYEFDNELTLLNPILVVEVTSTSSYMYDRVDKLGFYLDVPSIAAYLIVEQERMRVDLCIRADGGWNVRVFDQPDDVIPLAALECELPLAEIYKGIEIAQES